jgi:sRNA-binding regulator protein Hfq
LHYRSEKEAGKTWPNPDLDFDEDSARKLNDAVTTLKKSSPDQFKSAMESFKNAHTTATLVFFTESLNLQDRIMAAKLRIHSRMLLHLENPARAKVCKLYLKHLHDLSPIVEIFRCDLEGGMLSKLNKAERHELVQSVSIINFVLFRFLNCYTKEPVNVYDWPLIENDAWMYNPLIPDETVLQELQQARIEVPNLVVFEPIQTRVMGIDPQPLAINSEGDLIVFRQRSTNRDVCELLKVSRNEVKMFYTFPEFTLVSFLAVDDADFVYVFADNVKGGEIPPGYSMYDVSVFDPRGDINAIYKHFLLFDGSVVLAPTPREYKVALCLPAGVKKERIREEVDIRREERIQREVNIRNGEKIQGEVTIRSEERIQGEVNIRNREKIRGEVTIRSEEKIQGEVNIRNGEKIRGEVTIRSEEKIQGEVNIHVKNPRELSIGSILVKIKKRETTLTTITDKLQVVAIERSGYQVRIFEEDGRFVREFELHNGKRETCVGITFNSFTKELVVVSRVQSGHFLSTYLPETGERRHNVRLAHIGEDCQEIQLISHCRGSMALVTKGHVLYLQ